MDGQIRILIADDHDLIRKGLSLMINSHSDFLLVGEAATGKQAVELCNDLKPDVVLMDLSMPEMDGIKATAIINECHPNICVIALTSYDDEHLVRDALQAGVTSYVLKTTSSNDLADIIRTAIQGTPTLSPEVLHTLVNAMKAPAPGNYDLTEREKIVLRLMVQGLSNAQIAEELVLSIPTIKKHVHNILTKLGVPNRTKAALFAVQHRLVED